ncbi:MAG: hypothetical protein O3A47_08550 [Chloroflexi bacterium]|nr:hypothetical protein [Chloroflexota bacterium]
MANDASTILYLALSGDDPVNIVTSCDEEFQWSTSWGNILWPVITDCLPKLTQEFIELARMYESRMERGELSEIRAAGELYLPYLDLLNAWKPPSWLHWEVEGGTGAYRLNPDSYNPAKSKSVSLTTWLFGAADRPMQGALWRRLCRLYKNEVAWAKHTCAYHPGVSYGDENDGDEVDRPIELLPDDHKAPLGEEEEGALRKILGKYQATCEVSVRDIAIVRLKLAQDMSEDPLTYAEIGQELGLSLGERQLKRIWRQFEDWRDCHDSEVRRDLGM